MVFQKNNFIIFLKNYWMHDSSFSFDAPWQKIIFLLEACPDLTWTEDFDTPSFLLRNAHNSAFAFPSSGGAETAIFIEVP